MTLRWAHKFSDQSRRNNKIREGIPINFHPDHLADLKASHLSDAIIEAMAVHSMAPAEIPRFLGYDASGIVSALAFPYFHPDGKKNGHVRLKVFPPYKVKGGKPRKYLQQKNTASRLYILPVVGGVLQSVGVPLYLVEGEKKAARAVDLGIAAIGFGGVWSWLRPSTRDLIDDFSLVNLWHREIVVVPDSDIWAEGKAHDEARFAIFALGRALRDRGARIKFTILPQPPIGPSEEECQKMDSMISPS